MQNYGWGLPVDISTHGWQIDRLILFFHVSMFVLFFGWLAFMVYALVKFRARAGHKAEYESKHFKLPTFLEIGIAILELVLLVVFSMPIWARYREVPPDVKNSVRVRIVAEQFAWNVHYPGADGKFGKVDPKLMGASSPVGLDPNDAAGKDDIVTINQLHIPVNTPIVVDLTSKDVIHSFSLPVARVKQDVIPGQATSVWFETKQTGEFEIVCAQLCGLGHYRMRGFFVVESKEDFAKWLREQAPQQEVIETTPEAAAVPTGPSTDAPLPAAPLKH